MKTKLRLIALIVIGLSAFQSPVLAQVKNIDVKNLSSSQIRQAQQALGSSGLSVDQAIAEARKNGASEIQIQQMMKRMGMKELGAAIDTIKLTPDSNQYLMLDSLQRNEQEKPSGDSGIDLPLEKENFGSYLFRSKNLTFEPSLNIQTPKNYEINIGDEILINIWGNSVRNYQLNVDKNGQIQIPQIGPVYIAGQTFDNAAKLIKRRLIAIYADLAGQQANTFAQVSMGRLRSIHINMVGELSMPGTYTLPATATVFNALYLSGGPQKYGSFRNIEIHRDGKLLQTIDIYNFLLKADQSDNIILKSNDVIFVPIAKKRVEITGEFKRKAFFELREDESLEDLVSFAGGFSESAYTLNVKLYRKTQDGINIFDIPVENMNTTSLQDGDIIIAEKIREEVENRIVIAGSVYRPGEYQWSKGILLSELIQKAEGIVADAEVEMGHLSRLNPDATLSLIAFNVHEVINGINDFQLEPKDYIMIKSHFDLKDKPTITVDGKVRQGGSFEFQDNMSVMDAIFLAGGFREDADTNFVQIARRLNYDEAALLSDKLVDIFSIPISRSMRVKGGESGFALMPYDRVYIRKAPGAIEHQTVQINGEVQYAGYYAIQNKKDRISDLIEWSGGLTPEAYVEAATLVKVEAGPVGINLQKILDNRNSRFDLKLSPGDVLTIPLKPETVNVFGEVQNPFAMVFEPNRSVKYYIRKSGGWGQSPHKRRIYVTYPDGSSAMTRNFLAWRYPKVKPGVKIHVPKKPARPKTGNTVATLLATASTAASVGIAITTLASLINKD